MSEKIDPLKSISFDNLPPESRNRHSKPQLDFQEKMKKALEERKKKMEEVKTGL